MREDGESHPGKWLFVFAIGMGIVGLALIWLGLSWGSLEALGGAPKAARPELALAEYVRGLGSPVGIAHAGDGSGRLFVVEQQGCVRIVQDGALMAAPFLDIRERVSCCGERGLWSVAFPPDYARKGHFYVYYTDASDRVILARYRVSADANLADKDSEQILLTIEYPPNTSDGGSLAFGPDGYLYIGVSDERSADGSRSNAQNLYALLGKLLRVDVESGVYPYAIPADNPYTAGAAYRREIWASGLRHPRHMAFDPLTQDLFVADAGQTDYEEINVQAAGSKGGENYGWQVMEGPNCRNKDCDRQHLVLPVAGYDHSQGCMVVGGAVYRGAQYPGMQGLYLYGDYCSGNIWGLWRKEDKWQTRLLLQTGLALSAFGVSETGNLYVVDYSEGVLYAVGTLP